MAEYDRLPQELRIWLSTAMLPWRARSVQAAYEKALAHTGDPAHALADLDRIERKLIAKDAKRLWGSEHPEAVG